MSGRLLIKLSHFVVAWSLQTLHIFHQPLLLHISFSDLDIMSRSQESQNGKTAGSIVSARILFNRVDQTMHNRLSMPFAVYGREILMHFWIGHNFNVGFSLRLFSAKYFKLSMMIVSIELYSFIPVYIQSSLRLI